MHWDVSFSMNWLTLQFTVNKWDWSELAESNKFQALKNLILHSYYTQVNRVLILIMQCDLVTVDLKDK